MHVLREKQFLFAGREVGMVNLLSTCILLMLFSFSRDFFQS